MLERYILNTSIFLLLTLRTAAQPAIVWDTLLGEHGVDEAVGMVQNYNGQIAILSSTTSDSWGEDFWFMLMEPSGEIVLSRAFGTIYPDQPKKVLKSHDGGFVLMGDINRVSTQGASTDRKSPLIIKINQQGEKEFLSVVFLNQNFELQDGVELANGDILLLLVSAGENYLLTARSNMEYPLKIPCKSSCHFEKILVTESGSFLIGTGESGELVLRQFDAHTLTFDSTFTFSPTFPIEAIGDVKAISNSSIKIAATLKIPREGLNMGLLSIDLTHGKLETTQFGGRLDDQGLAYEILNDGAEWLAGSSLSNRESRSRVSDGLIYTKNPNGRERSFFVGGTGQDEIVGLLTLADQGILSLQSTASGEARRRDIRITKYETPNIPYPSGEKLLLREVRLVDADDDSRLRENEFAYIELQLENPHNGNIPSSKLLINSDQPESLIVPTSVLTGNFRPGQIRSLHIPVRARAIHESKTIRVEISGDFIEQNISLPITMEGKATAQLAFGTLMVELADSANADRPYLLMQVEVINKGNLPSDSMEVVFNYPNVFDAKDESMLLPPLGSGQTHLIEQQLIPGLLPPDSLMRFIAIMYDMDDSLLLRKEESVNVRKVLDPLRQKSVVTFLENRKGLLLSQASKIKREDLVIPKIDEEPEARPEPILYIVWNDPSPLKDYDQYKEYELASYTVRLAVITDYALEKETISCNLHLNNMLYATESASNKLTGGEQVSFFQYWYEQVIQLKEGENRIHLEIRNSDGTLYRSDPMVIHYSPPRAKAHIYAFGVPHDDLPYVAKDAADFIALFENQNNLLFSTVNTHLFNTQEGTTIESLHKALINLENDYWKYERIQENDVIFIYFSTHGFTYGLNNEEFRLASSDFDRRYERLYSLDFKKDLLEVLKPMRCKIILLMDACYSGQIAYINAPIGVKGMTDSFDLEMSKAISRIAETENDLYFLLSCEPEEKSYADASWNNSAFTKALIEYLDPESADRSLLPDAYSDDPIITMGELFAYLSNRVPEIVRGKKDIDTQQHPMLVNGDKVMDLPIYVRKN